MAITASGLYGLTVEKMLIDTAAESLESETDVRCALILDTYAQDYNTHAFWNSAAAGEPGEHEVSGTGYAAGGELLTTTELTIASGVLTYDAADVSWASSTITDAMAAVGYFQVGADLTTPADDMLVFLSDFVTAASSSNGTFTVQWNASGIFTLDFTP